MAKKQQGNKSSKKKRVGIFAAIAAALGTVGGILMRKRKGDATAA